MISIKIKDPIFTYRAQLINILDFNPKKISIEKVCAINHELERIYYVKYGGDPFYLVIDDLKGCFFMINVDYMSIVIRSVYRTCFDRFYPQIHLVSCTYKEC